MDRKDIDAIYNLMQNVSDKLSGLSNKIDSKNHEPEVQNIIKKQDTTIAYLVHLTNGLEKSTKTKSENTNNYNEYVLFGKDSTMNSRVLFILASLIFVAWLGFKYVAPVIVKQEKLELENTNYRMMHEYLYLKDIREEPSNYTMLQLVKNIQTRDANFLKEFNKMVSQHRLTRRRIELENELEKLK